MSQLRDYLEKQPSETQRLLGMDYDQLTELIIRAENLYERHKKEREIQKTRIIKPGSGRPPKQGERILLNTVHQWRVYFDINSPFLEATDRLCNDFCKKKI